MQLVAHIWNITVDNPISKQLKRNLSPRLEANRMAILLFTSVLANVVLSFCFVGLMPLKERIPYFVSSNRETGLVQVSSTVAQKFTPTEQNIKYFAARFVRELLIIDPYRTKSEYLPAVKTVVLGKAKSQVNEFLTADTTLERMAKDPSLERNIEIERITILPSAENVVEAVVKLITLSGNNAAQTGTKVVSMHYALEPVKSDAEALRNPIGFYVTQFVIDDELGQ